MLLQINGFLKLLQAKIVYTSGDFKRPGKLRRSPLLSTFPSQPTQLEWFWRDFGVKRGCVYSFPWFSVKFMGKGSSVPIGLSKSNKRLTNQANFQEITHSYYWHLSPFFYRIIKEMHCVWLSPFEEINGESHHVCVCLAGAIVRKAICCVLHNFWQVLSPIIVVMFWDLDVTQDLLVAYKIYLTSIFNQFF